jgi:hypothetical protein
MDTTQTITIIASILIPMLAGFGWIIHQIRDVDKRLANVETRLTVVETILAMCGAPIKGHIMPKIDNQ